VGLQAVCGGQQVMMGWAGLQIVVALEAFSVLVMLAAECPH
jgi:hypothetical protein